MPQIFRPASNSISKLSILIGLGLLFAGGAVADRVKRSNYITGVGIFRQQPVPFSHQHHVGGLGIDCRYCHTSVETSSFAGIPSTETCMTCHSQVWKNSPMLRPVRESLEKNVPLHWNRVTSLPQFVYFNHSVHVRKGVSCLSCHGRVDQMPLMAKSRTFFMRDCLSCHRQPQKSLGPLSEVFAMPLVSHPNFIPQKISHPERLTNCYVCHR